MLKKKQRLLWSGGLRSTYRLIELCRQPNVKVQPVVIAFTQQAATAHEVTAQRNILAWLLSHKQPTGKLLPPSYLTENQVIVSEALARRFDRLLAAFPDLVDPRWLTLAAYAEKARKIDFCGVIPEEISQFCNTSAAGSGTAGASVGADTPSAGRDVASSADTPRSASGAVRDTSSLFANFSLQCSSLTDSEMFDHLQRWGYGDVLPLLWSCRHPYNGEPCGVCPACLRNIKAGLSSYSSPAIQKRHSYLMALYKSGQEEDAELYKAYVHRELAGVIEMYRAVLDGSGFERGVLPEEVSRIEEKLKHLEEEKRVFQKLA